jgi:hypothetical protein
MDWTGNKKSTFINIGASNHTDKERDENDFYATDPIAIELLMDEVKFNSLILEPACGMGHLSDAMKNRGYEVHSSDLINRGYGEQVDFLSNDVNTWNGDIITNPPYKYAQEFIEKSLLITNKGALIAMFLKVQFMEGKKRKILFKSNPPKYIYVSSSRILCAKNAEFQRMIDGGGSAVAYAWYIWEKGYTGDTILKWFN